jgi:hypothetical protein
VIVSSCVLAFEPSPITKLHGKLIAFQLLLAFFDVRQILRVVRTDGYFSKRTRSLSMTRTRARHFPFS